MSGKCDAIPFYCHIYLELTNSKEACKLSNRFQNLCVNREQATGTTDSQFVTYFFCVRYKSASSRRGCLLNDLGL